MELEIKRVPAFEVEGKRFDTKKEAELHIAKCRLDIVLKDAGVGNAGGWDREEILEWLIEARWPLICLLTEIHRRMPDPGPPAGEE